MPIRQKRSFMIGLRSDTRLFADNDSSAAAPPGYQNAPAMGAAFHVWPAFLPARPSQAAIGLLLAAALLAKVRQKIRDKRHKFSLSAHSKTTRLKMAKCRRTDFAPPKPLISRWPSRWQGGLPILEKPV
jgi:hypothetical protein